jgi:CBS domain-containing protein
MRATLAGLLVDQAMVRRIVALAPSEPLSSAVGYMLAGFQDDIPVAEEGRLVGLISREDVLRATVSGDARAPVSSVMKIEVPTVTEADSLDVALERLRQTGRRSIPVVRGEVLVGLLPIENVAYFLRVRERDRVAVAYG